MGRASGRTVPGPSRRVRSWWSERQEGRDTRSGLPLSLLAQHYTGDGATSRESFSGGFSRCRNRGRRKTGSRPATYGVEAVPIHLREANLFIKAHHRHSIPVVGGKFAIGCQVDGKLVGVAVAGRPVARKLDDGRTLEVLRVCCDGTPNACSFLYGRVRRIGQLMGYERIFTYTLASEPGSSLKAAGAKLVGEVRPQEWSVPSRPRRSQPVYQEPKLKWQL